MQDNFGSTVSLKKKLTAALAAVCALVLILVGFLLLKSPLYCVRAEKKAEAGEYRQAQSILKSCTGEKADALSEYISLRIDINTQYPSLITDYNPDTIYTWSSTVAGLKEKSELFPDEINRKINVLDSRLNSVISLSGEYDALRSYVLELMDIFTEINRLYTKGTDGNNISFTVSEELGKVERWQYLIGLLSGFSEKVEGNDDLYLLNYLIKEATGEAEDIRQAMDVVRQSGYTDNDSVRVSGSAEKTFPNVTNSSGNTVNVLRKDEYEAFLSSGVYRSLVKGLGEFYGT